ncbi:hypothetical protein, partial [Janthinobacterium sp. Ant5-2-1]|uniref:hypothetical protein n=1 Tax=Janthinobacterium sp. Ant5-2-1 TaxID=1755239 RepID=UPI001F158AA4
ELHKPYQNVRTGFSLNRAIPYHLYNLYYVSACLASIIKIHGRAGVTSEVNINDDYFRATFSEVEKIPCMLLPDEMEKPLPIVVRKNNENYRLEFPGKKEILNRYPHIADVSLETRIGVWDRGIAPPYMQESK